MNKKLNNPTRQHHHPQYHPLRMLPNSAILDCNVMNSSEEKWYVVPQRLENINFYISVLKVRFNREWRQLQSLHIIVFSFAGLWTLIRIRAQNQLVENNGSRHNH